MILSQRHLIKVISGNGLGLFALGCPCTARAWSSPSTGYSKGSSTLGRPIRRPGVGENSSWDIQLYILGRSNSTISTYLSLYVDATVGMYVISAFCLLILIFRPFSHLLLASFGSVCRRVPPRRNPFRTPSLTNSCISRL